MLPSLEFARIPIRWECLPILFLPRVSPFLSKQLPSLSMSFFIGKMELRRILAL